ncbi:hypothetical protein ANN_26575 [Periplaneta americana]|uniref:Histone-lysine N-methyltransferase SETMAR n=1 Tax=Periplaneta americana TaxID=6978 RepID=A0ABQ8RYF9_PERAM|nr:hypothetical protein ANN_26575 [Periplaneta americana]
MAGLYEGGNEPPGSLKASDNAGEMSPESSTESYPAFARIGLRENPGKNLNQVTCPDRDSNPGHLVSQPDALTVTPQRKMATSLTAVRIDCHFMITTEEQTKEHNVPTIPYYEDKYQLHDISVTGLMFGARGSIPNFSSKFLVGGSVDVILDVCVKEVEIVDNKRRGILSGIVLLHDNARSHTAPATKRLLQPSRWEVFDHPPYSLDLAPSDFLLFPHMKLSVGGQYFGTDNELQTSLVI